MTSLTDMRTPSDGQSTSAMMEGLADRLNCEQISAGEFIDLLDGRGIGFLLLVLSLPLCVPNVPGISTLFGLLLILPAWQMMRGQQTVWLPHFIRRRQIKGANLKRALGACAGLLRKLEVMARPRLPVLAIWPTTCVLGVQTLILALVLIIPMPGANLIPAVAIALTGMAMLQKDGLLTILSVPVAIAAVTWVYFGSIYAFDALHWLGHLSLA